ncbi:MAG: hypothetical protein M1819_003561 [Sarea resinae]|nr:MAG: hypothetical protein M1819_003561 [Sarea resinae]
MTQFIQYLLLTPTYINILNVYAFCNTHDITWGTKGDDKPEKLPTATLKPGGKVDVEIPQDDGDLNMQYENEMRMFAAKAPKEKRVVSEAEHQEDYYKGFRSAVVLVWMFCNLALAAAVLRTAGLENIDKKTDSDRNATIYMAVVLWSVAALSAFSSEASDADEWTGFPSLGVRFPGVRGNYSSAIFTTTCGKAADDFYDPLKFTLMDCSFVL